MSKTKLSLRLMGNLPSQEELAHILGIPVKVRSRRGDWNIALEREQMYDVAVAELAKWGEHTGIDDDVVPREQLLSSSAVLKRMAPTLSEIDHSIKRELYLSIVRTQDQGGFELPAQLIDAASSAGLSLSISITIVLDEDDG